MAAQVTLTAKRQRSLKQLRGGLRAWRDLGIPIKGEIKGHEVTIEYHSRACIILLSVEDGDESELQVHSSAFELTNPVVIASVPENFLQELARLCGSTRDLVEILLSSRDSPPISSGEANRLLLVRQQESWKLSPFHLVPGYYHDGIHRFYTRALLSLRQSLVDHSPEQRWIEGPYQIIVAILDDLGWPGLYQILSQLWSPYDPGPIRIWHPHGSTPQTTPQEILSNLELTFDFLEKFHGHKKLCVTSLIEVPPAHAAFWPRIQSHSIRELHIGSYQFLIARIAMRMDSSWHNEWKAAWDKIRSSHPNKAHPQGIIMFEAEVGLMGIFVGSTAISESETQRLIYDACKGV